MSSLSLLLPGSRVTTTDPSSSSLSSSLGSPTTQTAADLEDHTRALIAAFNSRDGHTFASLGAYFFAPSFRAELCVACGPHTFEEMKVCSDNILARWPGHHMQIVGIEVVVDEEEEEERGKEYGEEGGKRDGASVYMFNELLGVPGGVKRRGVTVMRWRRLRGRWRCVRWSVIRGIGGPWVGE